MASSTTLPKIIIVCGPTATGKSALAIRLTKQFNGEVISADSRQVYKGMNLGTGKVTKKEMSGIAHHLLDVAHPKNVFSVGDFQALAQKAIHEVLKKGKLPIVCGGTGFYIQAAVDNVVLPSVPANPKLRAQLQKKSVAELFEIIRKIDSRRAAELDTNNKVRLIRAIEIGKALGSVPPLASQPLYKPLFIGLDMPSDILQEKIRTRLDERLKKGMVREVSTLHKKGVSWKRMYELGLEYRYIALYLQKKLTRVEMESQLFYAIWHFAKRQRTWFRIDARIHWMKPAEWRRAVALTRKFVGTKNRPLRKKRAA